VPQVDPDVEHQQRRGDKPPEPPDQPGLMQKIRAWWGGIFK
jgi:hypothetical protein